jgi:hypothetical protein
MLLGNATKAELRLIVWCRGVEPKPGPGWGHGLRLTLPRPLNADFGARLAKTIDRRDAGITARPSTYRPGALRQAVVIAQYFVSVAGIE